MMDESAYENNIKRIRHIKDKKLSLENNDANLEGCASFFIIYM